MPRDTRSLDSWWWAVAALIHGFALLLYLDWSEIVTNPPVADTDFAAHWAETWAVSHYLGNGHLWGYDPSFMAGYPAGVLTDLDNKLIEVLSWALTATGLSLEASYNVVLVVLIVIAPLCLYPAARWSGLARSESFVAQLAALGLWYADPALHWSWQGGAFAFAAAVFVALLVLAAAIRLTDDSRSPPGIAPYLVWFVVGPVLFWLHAFSFFLLLVPLGVLTISRWRSIGVRRRLLLSLWPPLVVVVNVPWLLPSLRFLDMRTGSDDFLQGGLAALAADALGLGTIDGASEPGLLGLRWIVLILGAAGLVWLGRSRNAGAWSVAAGAWTGLLLAYGAVYLPDGGDLQPYRYIEQAMIWSTLGLAAGGRQVIDWLSRFGTGRVSWAARGATVLLAVAAAAWIANGAWPSRPPQLGGPALHRWRGVGADARSVCDFLAGTRADSGRVLVDDWRLGAILPWCSGAEVIGGPFLYVPMDYGHASTTPWSLATVAYPDYSAAAWRDVTRTYRLRWLVLNEGYPPAWFTLGDWLGDHDELARPVAEFGAYRVWRIALPERELRVRADDQGITVANPPAGASVVLPYHWVTGLVAGDPAAKLEPRFRGSDPVPFITVRVLESRPVHICLRPSCAYPAGLEVRISSWSAGRRR